MISAFANTFKIPELRSRILFTLLVVVIVRLGAVITLPGVDANVLQDWYGQVEEQSSDSRGLTAVLALMNVFSGGGLQNSALFALGIMPYISASIMMQLLTAVVPSLGKLSREEGGRQKISLYTRVLTLVLCLFQGWMLAKSLVTPEANPFLRDIASGSTRELVPDAGLLFIIKTVIIITAGTMFLMWLGDQITERGIGNGVSIIITVNIIYALPGALFQVYNTYVASAGDNLLRPFQLVALLAFLFFVVAAVISITQAQRRVPINYAKQVRGGKMYGGQSQHMPLKVNYAGVMPIIFAQAILMFPSQIIGWTFPNEVWAQNLSMTLGGGGSGIVFYTLTGLMIFFFSYFWVATMFQPNQIADDLKKNGGYIPGVRPGKPTAEFLDRTMSRLTFAGAIFLTIVAILPPILTALMGVPPLAAQFFGGTGLLIMVGVLLDVMRQVETHLIQRHYDGFLRKGKIRGRYDRPGIKGAPASGNQILWLLVIVAVLVIGGIVYYEVAKQ
ncbi:MAG: preprotein translocase subunit SecY [Verrucomicrobiales bacterium]|jgi:preprotein translocase subunit SecY|nr:preprotein translocase subunit SecY [Verrucomicrobiales bacterium]MDP4938528.1 preprotein translocase subunit SecY [Verrucomicrobiales bacterium]MDP5004247.1 preprotein translocase subunit SecY [Verrucomicrobiales bacterium]